MTYDPQAYWADRGATYRDSFEAARYKDQERVLARLLRNLDFASVLEVGCGFGRIADLVARVRPGVQYTGIDFSPAMLASASPVSGVLVESSLEAYEPGRRFDLVLAVEVLMHVPPAAIVAAAAKLRSLAARHLVTVDWTVPVREPFAHNFLHDYRALLGRETHAFQVGRQTVRHQVMA